MEHPSVYRQQQRLRFTNTQQHKCYHSLFYLAKHRHKIHSTIIILTRHKHLDVWHNLGKSWDYVVSSLEIVVKTVIISQLLNTVSCSCGCCGTIQFKFLYRHELPYLLYLALIHLTYSRSTILSFGFWKTKHNSKTFMLNELWFVHRNTSSNWNIRFKANVIRISPIYSWVLESYDRLIACLSCKIARWS